MGILGGFLEDSLILMIRSLLMNPRRNSLPLDGQLPIQRNGNSIGSQMDGVVDGRRPAAHQQPAHFHHQSNGGAHFNSAGSAGSASTGIMYSPPHSAYPPLPFPIPFSANFPLPLALPFGSSLNTKPNWVHLLSIRFIQSSLMWQ